MERNGYPGELPAEVFDPKPDSARLAAILVRLGFFIASTSVLAFLNPLPGVGLLGAEYAPYVFYSVFAVLFVFGIGLVVLGWRVADRPGDYNVAAVTAIRVAQMVLVLAVALSQFYSNGIP